MANEDDEILREFLVESWDNLSRLDQEMVELEQQPDRPDLIASIFRTVHTIKGTCGFLGFGRLEAMAHVTEDILNELRQNRRRLDAPLTSLVLRAVDAVKRILQSIQRGQGEGVVFESELLMQLEQSRDGRVAEVECPPQSDGIEKAQPGHEQQASISDSALRVDVGLLDRLMNLVGELVLTRNQVLQYHSACEDPALATISQRLNLITTELQEGVMKTRMQPIGLVWNKLPRIVRDLSTALGKEIDLQMEGSRTELDRTILDAIKDPLTHIVRNCCDHGIEAPGSRIVAGKPARGKLTLHAYHEGGQVNIEIADDGAGIDPEKVKAKAIERGLVSAEQASRLSDRDAVNLVFLPGFSMAAQITNISGRGVGMDVVKTHIERIGGTVELISERGRGMTVRIRIPLTLAIIPGLVVSAGGERFVIPQVNLHELIRLEGDEAKLVEHVHSTPVFRRRNELLPVADLASVLGLPSTRPPDEVSIIVLQADEHRFGLIVDHIGDSQEIVVKPLGQQLKSLNCYAGATIMGDGKIAIILDIMGLGLRSGVIGASRAAARRDDPLPVPAAAEEVRHTLLLCRAGHFERLAIPLARAARLENIPASSIERASGRAAVQYRNRILPLVEVGEMLGGADLAGQPSSPETIQVIVCRIGGTEFGLVVDEISDIIEETLSEPYPSERAGVMASAVVAGRITDLLDIESIARWGSVSAGDGLGKLREALAGDGSAFVLEEARA